MSERVGFLPLEKFRFDQSLSKDFKINAHWALYCDNYLEGFHITFVHDDLNSVLDYGDYETEIDDYFVLQIGRKCVSTQDESGRGSPEGLPPTRQKTERHIRIARQGD